MPEFIAFGTCDMGGFFVFGVLNAKNLAFSTSDTSALRFMQINLFYLH